jgi:hypothetical protein
VRLRRPSARLASALALVIAVVSCSPFADSTNTGDRASDAAPFDASAVDAGTPISSGGIDGMTPMPIDETKPLVGSTCNGTIDCARYVFVTSETFSGTDMGGALGADGRCQLAGSRQQTAPALRNRKWQAWVSDGSISTAARLTHGKKPYWLPGHILLANSWEQLTSLSLLHAIDVDETGKTLDPAPSFFVWTGTVPNGTAAPERCMDWSLEGSTGAVGNAHAKDSTWSFTGFEGHPLYCIER